MKQFWLEKDACSGCGMCANICPVGAISMQEDASGFIYPSISSACIDCNACQKHCEARLRPSQHAEQPETYAAWSGDPEIRFSSTSGGLFSELVKGILERGGSVVGAQYDQNHMVEHVMVDSPEGLERLRQSKYIQSRPGMIYKEVKQKLDSGATVAFCGAPCQVAALYAFLGSRDYSNLYTIDFICRGMNSPKAFRSWLEEIERQEKSSVTRVWFKYKEGGWNSSPTRTRLDFADGHSSVKEKTENLFMHGYLSSNLYIRPSCGNCAFKGVPRCADITLADFWGIEESLDDDKGTSLVLVNSERGKRLFDEAKERLVSYKRDFSEIFAGNVCFTESVPVPKDSERFLRELDQGTFSEVLKKYTAVPLWKRGLRKTKRILSRLLK